MSAPSGLAALRPPRRWWPKAVELACRGGYVARGFVYVCLGTIALLAALDIAPRAKGVMASLETWADWRAGFLLLWLTGLGLYAFAAWRGIQALFDADRLGTGPKALAARAGQAISGLTYAALAVSTFGLVDALEDLNEADDEARTRAAVEQMLAAPAGELLVAAAGLFIFGCGAGGIVQAAARDFCKRTRCDRETAGRFAVLGRIGYAARGTVFLVAGAFLTLAGLHGSSGEAKGAGAALEWMAARGVGDAGLGLIAIGLIAFGAYAWFEARFRMMSIRTALK